MKINKLIIGLMLVMVLTSLASATQQSLGTFKQDSEIQLTQTCSSCSEINFTKVTYPDNTEALGNVQANKDGSVFTYPFNNTDQLGEYLVYGIGDVDGEDTVFAYSFKITPTGSDEISVALVVILFLATLLFGFFSWFFHKDVFLHIIFLFASMIVLLYAINQMHIPMLFFTVTVVIMVSFVYYIINYMKEMMSSFRQKKGWEI